MSDLDIAFVTFGEIEKIPSAYKRSCRMAKEIENMGYNSNFYSGITPEQQPDNIPNKIKLLKNRLFSRMKQLPQITEHNVIYLNKKFDPYSFPPLFIYYIKNFTDCTLIYDICDPVWVKTPFRSHQTLKMADCVVTSGNSLKQYAEQYNDQVFIVPMSVEVDKFKPINRTKNKNPIIGWVGDGPYYKDYLQFLIDPLSSLSKKFDFKLFITSAQNDEDIYSLFENVPFECDIHDWIPENDLVFEMNQIDIGVAPLLETDWAEGKSPIKILEYSACGIPVVASDVGDARQMIHDGQDGFLASNKKEWHQKLSDLLSDECLRDQMGQKGREKAVNEFSFEANAARLVEIIEMVHNHQ